MKSFGIASFTLSIIAIITPIIGVFITSISGVLALFSIGKGTSLGMAAVLLNFVNIIALSPSLILAAGQQLKSSGERELSNAFGILLSIQLIVLIAFTIKWFSNRKRKHA